MVQQLQRRSWAAALWLAASSAAALAEPADAVLQWNELAQQTVAPANPFIQSRSMAIAQLAVLDAASAGAEVPAAAVMAAAHDALQALHPDSATSLEAALAAGLATMAGDDAKAHSIELGREAAARILERRHTDGWDAKSDYLPGNGPGVWVPTPPASAPALVPHWGKVAPFALESGQQFRPGAPSPIDSAKYIEDLREVFERGGADSSKRSAELSDAARFWTVSAVQTWNPAARQASVAAQQSLTEQARTLAMLNVAIADALIACFDAKYAYNVWRPVTAIRAGGVGDIGPAPDWLPLIATPPFPAYPSAHACAAGAASEVLERTFGPDGHALELTSAAAPGVTFRYPSFEAIARQVDDARVYGGIHVREDQEVGGRLGREVGGFVYTTLGRAE